MRVTAAGALLALVVILAGCGSDGGSPDGGPPAPVANTGAKANPPATAFDAEVILCRNGSGITAHCRSTAASGPQIAAVATKLRADAGVDAVYYLSAADVEKVDRQALSPAERSQLPASGDRRPEFLVAFAGDGADHDGFVDTYSRLPGVDEATLCVEDDTCRVSTLRAAGVLG